MGSGSGTEETKKPHCKKSAFAPQGTTVPGRHQHLEASLGLLRKRLERKHQDKLVSASLGLSKPRLVEVMADLTTLESSQHYSISPGIRWYLSRHVDSVKKRCKKQSKRSCDAKERDDRLLQSSF